MHDRYLVTTRVLVWHGVYSGAFLNKCFRDSPPLAASSLHWAAPCGPRCSAVRAPGHVPCSPCTAFGRGGCGVWVTVTGERKILRKSCSGGWSSATTMAGPLSILCCRPSTGLLSVRFPLPSVGLPGLEATDYVSALPLGNRRRTKQTYWKMQGTYFYFYLQPSSETT